LCDTIFFSKWNNVASSSVEIKQYITKTAYIHFKFVFFITEEKKEEEEEASDDDMGFGMYETLILIDAYSFWDGPFLTDGPFI
jgi:hypothetical protein